MEDEARNNPAQVVSATGFSPAEPRVARALIAKP
jgi:hypothetical protein